MTQLINLFLSFKQHGNALDLSLNRCFESKHAKLVFNLI